MACAASRDRSSATGGLSTWSEVRGQFELDEAFTHLGAMYIASHPRPVREAIARHRKGLQENPVQYVLDNDTPRRLEAVEEAARFFGASRGNVALTDSTTMALSLLYNGLALEEGDEIILEEGAYYSTVESLEYKSRRSGAVLKQVRLHDEPASASADEMAQRLLDAVGARTRVMALTWIHSDTGVKLPLGEVARRLGELNRSRPPQEQVLLCVDGVHGLGVEDVRLGELGCHFFASGTHKWMFGPRGTGVLYAARSSLWDRLVPTIPAFGVQSTPGLLMSPGGFHAFEHRWALADAFRFIRDVGMPRIASRTRELASRLKEGLSEVRGVTVLTPRSPELSAGIVAFQLAGMSPARLAARLVAKRLIVTPSTYGVPSVRASPSIINTPEEVDRLVRAVAEL